MANITVNELETSEMEIFPENTYEGKTCTKSMYIRFETVKRAQIRILPKNFIDYLNIQIEEIITDVDTL